MLLGGVVSDAPKPLSERPTPAQLRMIGVRHRDNPPDEDGEYRSVVQCDRRDLLAEVAALEAERDEAQAGLAAAFQYRTGHLPTCGGMDFEQMRCGCGYLDGTAYRDLVAERDALRTEVGRLGTGRQS